MSAKKVLVLLLVFGPLFVSSADQEGWNNFISKYDTFIFPWRNSFVGVLRNVLVQPDVKINPECRRHLKMYADKLENKTYEAMMMFDSFSNPKPGIESNLVYDMGHYETCHKARLDGLPGKFVFLKVRWPLPSTEDCMELYDSSFVNSSWSLKQPKKFVMSKLLPLLLGLCVPSTCTYEDLNSTINSNSFKKMFEPSYFEVAEPYTTDDPRYPLMKSVAKWTILTIVLLNLISSYFNIQSDRFLSHFNMRKNWEVLTRTPYNPSTQFVAQWKVFYSVLASLIHLFIPISGEVYYHMGIPVYEAMDTSNFARYVIFSFPTLVGFNFIISASLSVLMWRMYKKDNKINLISFVVVRAFRSLPVIVITTYFLILLPDMPGLENPMMKLFAGNVSGNCFENMWAEVLFYSNYVETPMMCSRVSWFVSSDMQLYACSFFLVMYLCNSRVSYESGKKVLRWVIGFAFLANFVVSYINVPVIQELMGFRLEQMMDDPWRITKLYFMTPQYILPYSIGMALGFEMSHGTQWPIDKARRWSWRLLFINFLSFYLPYCFDLAACSRVVLSLVITVQRFIFISTLAIYFYALWSRQNLNKTRVTTAGYICTVISRFQFPWFLIHPLIISYLVIWLGYTYTTYMKIVTVLFPGELVLTFLISALVHLMVEMPFANLFASLAQIKGSKGEKISTTCDKVE